jgi:DNA polymerase-3 subunit beta
MPALAQLTSDGPAVSIASGNGNIAIKATVAATIFEPGTVAVSADRLAALLNAIAPGATVLLTATERALLIASGDGRYRLPLAEPPAELSISGSAIAIKLDTNDLMTLFEPLPAAGTEETRPYLCGLFLHTYGGRLYAVAADGVTLLRTSIASAVQMPAGVIIPSSAVAVMARLIRRTKPEQVSLRRAGTLFEIGTEAFAFTTRAVDAIFPDYRRVIPDGPRLAVATCEAPPLAAALTRLSAIANAGRALNLVALAWSTGKPLRLFLPRQPDDGADAIAAAGTEGTARIALSLPAFAALVAEFDGLLRLEVEEGRALVIRDDSYKLGVLTFCRWNFEEAAALAD